jgi:hypothetical protein
LLERGAGALCVGLLGYRVKGALDPIGLRSDPWSVLDPRRMRMDGGVSANCFDHRDVEQVASRLIFTATHDPRVSGASHTKFVPVWRLRNPLNHPRVPPHLPQRLWGLEFAGGPRSLLVLRLPDVGRAETLRRARRSRCSQWVLEHFARGARVLDPDAPRASGLLLDHEPDEQRHECCSRFG